MPDTMIQVNYLENTKYFPISYHTEEIIAIEVGFNFNHLIRHSCPMGEIICGFIGIFAHLFKRT